MIDYKLLEKLCIANGISGDEKDDPNELAFRLVYDKYFSRASTYFSHIISPFLVNF